MERILIEYRLISLREIANYIIIDYINLNSRLFEFIYYIKVAIRL